MLQVNEQIPSQSELEEAKTAGFTHYPIIIEVLEDIFTPVGLYLRLRNSPNTGPSIGKNSFLLESAEGGENIGRYSFMGTDPFATFLVKNGTVTTTVGSHRTTSKASPISELRNFLSRFKVFPAKNLPRFSGGAVGYFGYDFVKYLENIPITESKNSLPEVFLNVYDTIFAVDNLKRKVLVVSLIPLSSNSLPKVVKDRLTRLRRIIKFVESSDHSRETKSCRIGEPKFNTTKMDYKGIVEKAKQYIIEGDIFQVVLSQRAEFNLKGDPFMLYRGVRALNPSPYMFYLDSTLGKRKLAIIGSSPEMFVRKEGRKIEMRPIAGTNPRGSTPEEDERLTRKLLADEKEKAEHVMLVDLGRNDIGRVATVGSVHVDNFMHVEKFSHVMHIVSDVAGTIDGGRDAVETLAACFPAGTLSGAPKVRAMEIISELEETRRQVYGGAVGYIDFNDNMDTCIAIRTFVIDGDKGYLQAGAGIVYDSDPEREYNETINKMKANLEALKLLS
ncbi:MAG TPA: anthranilate synthase component I [Candidatus Acidoferrales bacterium]|nr:anthranilate synthase component I [Candidatus Acidoferrales bacterium]